MPSKRRNNGRSKKNKGHSDVINCTNCGRIYPKDKAVKRFAMKKLVDESSRKDLEDNYAYDKQDFYLPKLYLKQTYCISCAIHARIVRGRSAKRGDRRLRYTTKVRNTNNAETRTNGFALLAPNLQKAFNRNANRPQN